MITARPRKLAVLAASFLSETWLQAPPEPSHILVQPGCTGCGQDLRHPDRRCRALLGAGGRRWGWAISAPGVVWCRSQDLKMPNKKDSTSVPNIFLYYRKCGLSPSFLGKNYSQADKACGFGRWLFVRNLALDRPRLALGGHTYS